MRLSRLTILLLLNSWILPAQEEYHIKRIEEYSSNIIYGICQDSLGAIWTTDSRDIQRYNGVSLRSYGFSKRFRISCDGSGTVFAVSSRDISIIDSKTDKWQTITPQEANYSDCAITSKDRTLYIGQGGNVLTVLRDNDTETLCTLPKNANITALKVMESGSILAATISNGLFRIAKNGVPECIYPCETKISAIEIDRKGNIWLTSREKGIIEINPLTLEVMNSFSSCNGHPISEPRVIRFCNSSIWVGAVNGLFEIKDGKLNEVSLEGGYGKPIQALLPDRNGNLWVATYYDGVYYIVLQDNPVSSLAVPRNLKYIKGIVCDTNDKIWVATDGNGLFSFSVEEGWKLTPATEGIKFQRLYFDQPTNSLWSGDYYGNLIQYDSNAKKFKTWALDDGVEHNTTSSITKILRHKGNLYIATMNGLFIFNPESPSSLSKVGGFNKTIYNLAPSSEGGLWIGSRGLYRLNQDGSFSTFSDSGFFTYLEEDLRGNLWAVNGRSGITELSDGKLIVYDIDNSGIPTIDALCSIPLNDGNVLICSRKGPTILNKTDRSAISYDLNKTPRIGRGIANSSCRLSDGRILINSSGGIDIFNPEKIRIPNEDSPIQFDRIYIPGSSELGLQPDRLVLGRDCRNFNIDVTAFNYNKIISTKYYYRLKGFNDSWTATTLDSPLSFHNLRHNNYTLEIMSRSYKSEDSIIARLPIRVKPFWYETLAAKLGYVFCAILILVLSFIYIVNRKTMAEKIKLKEKQVQDKSKYFVEFSYKLRTPLNIIIEKLERYFRDYGSRSPGIYNLEEIYSDSKSMRDLLSQYVDTQTRALENESNDPDSIRVVKDANFLNAVIGIIERNLSNESLDVGMLGKEMNMGKTKLSEKLKAISGMSPRDFIEDVRMRHAAKMLSDEICRIGEIAESLGFSSTKYFTQRFKLKFGCSPREFRQNQKEK